VAVLKVVRVLVSPVIAANVCNTKWAVHDTKNKSNKKGTENACKNSQKESNTRRGTESKQHEMANSRKRKMKK
jgi:hypothetical protein